MATTLVPLADRIVVRPLKKDEVTRGGIVLPDTAKEKSQEGEVIAVGPGRLSDTGKRLPLEVKAGDKVLFSRFAGTEFKTDDEEFLVLRENDILAKIT